MEMAPFDRLHTSSYWHSVLTMALSCIVSEINRDIGRKALFFIPHLHSTPPLGEYAVRFGTDILEWCGYTTAEKSEDMVTRFNTVHECGRQTPNQQNRPTDAARRHRRRYAAIVVRQIVTTLNFDWCPSVQLVFFGLPQKSSSVVTRNSDLYTRVTWICLRRLRIQYSITTDWCIACRLLRALRTKTYPKRFVTSLRYRTPAATVGIVQALLCLLLQAAVAELCFRSLCHSVCLSVSRITNRKKEN